jgi:predicted alpha/beta-fold hydrolase
VHFLCLFVAWRLLICVVADLEWAGILAPVGRAWTYGSRLVLLSEWRAADKSLEWRPCFLTWCIWIPCMLLSASQYVDFRPTRALRNAHLQSVLASLPPRRQLVRQAASALLNSAQPVIVECGAGVRLLGSFSKATARENKGLIVMLHGWEGSADSPYILSVAPRLLAEGYDLFRLNLRDHGASHHLNQELFHSCRLPEVVGAVEWIQQHYKPGRLFLAGFSLGGNFAMRVAASAADANLRIAKVIAICPVLDPAQTMHAMEQGWQGYQKYFIRKWLRSLRLKQQAHPGR